MAVGAIHLVPQRFSGKRILAQEKGAQLLLDNDRCALLDGAPVDSLSEIWEITAEEWREKKKALRNILGVKELS